MKFLVGLFLSLSVTLISCDVFPECENLTVSQFLALPNSCAEYIYCDGADSFKDNCPEGYLFNPVNSMCDDPANVDCSISEQNETGQVSTTASSPSTLTTASTSLSTQAPEALPTLTTTPLTSPATTSTSSGSESVSPATICPPSNSNQPESVPKPGSCSEYYLCYNGNAILMECPNKLEFNSVKRQCDWASEAKCVLNVATTVRPLDVCTGKFSGFFKYPENCHYYYRCTNGILTVQECPVGYGWDDNRKSCTPTGCATN